MTLADRKPETRQTTKPEKISGPYHYAVIVNLDGDEWPRSWAWDHFTEVAQKYDATRMGHSRACTTDMEFFTDKPLNEKQLAEDLGPNIEIIRVIDMNALGENDCFDVSNKEGKLYPLPGEEDTDEDANN